MLTAFLHGFILSIGLILPLGPQNTFVFAQGAMQPRFIAALPVVLVTSLCDTLLILVAVGGVSAAVLALPWLRTVLLVAGVLFLSYVGLLSWRSHTDDARVNATTAWSLRHRIGFAMSISLLNPHAIMDTIGVIGTSSLAYAGLPRWAFTSACIANSWLWFLGLAIVGRCLGRIGPIRRLIARASAVIMWASAGYLLYQLRYLF